MGVEIAMEIFYTISIKIHIISIVIILKKNSSEYSIRHWPVVRQLLNITYIHTYIILYFDTLASSTSAVFHEGRVEGHVVFMRGVLFTLI